MDTARQLIRWSIPGAIFVSLLSFYILFLVILAVNIGDMKDITGIVGDLTKSYILFMTTSSIPVGFITYQVYFWIYGNVKFHFVSVNKGKRIIEKVKCGMIDDLLKTQGKFYNIGRSIYKDKEECKDCDKKDGCTKKIDKDEEHEDMYEQYFLFPSLKDRKIYGSIPVDINRIMPNIYRLKINYRDVCGHILYKNCFHGYIDIIRYHLKVNFGEDKNTIEEYTSHFDVYHALGAARVSVLMSFLSFMFINMLILIKAHHRVHAACLLLLPDLLCLLNSLILIKVFSTNRDNALDSVSALLKHRFTNKHSKNISLSQHVSR